MVALPVKAAVTVPAEKLPEASRATMVLAVLTLVAASNLVLSVALMLPGAMDVAAEIEMAGVVPPDETMGAVPVTLVTVPFEGVAQLVLPMPSVVNTCPLVPLPVGNVRLVFVPLPFRVNEPPMVVLAFFKMVRALRLFEDDAPLPTTKSRSVSINSSKLPLPIVALIPITVSTYD